MFYSIYIIIVFLLPSCVHSSCCRLPFTDHECQVNRKGPHRYVIMPDRSSGLVMESTECYINDFDATYRKLVETKNYCNDCPGLLILHTNSSEIFLFPEYLEHILEGRTKMQRKNVVILTTSLVGAYDLDFTLFSRYYSSRSVDEIPSVYIDLQLPEYNSKLKKQPTLRLRVPSYNYDKEGLFKISRNELMNPLTYNERTMFHQLPFIYHFDIEKHNYPPTLCVLYDVEVSSSALIWKVLDSDVATCNKFMHYFGSNKCFATGFKKFFCSIEYGISMEDRFELSPYIDTDVYVERLTVAVTGGRYVVMALSNDQMQPARQVKILLLQGHLLVTDINTRLPIRVEYGSNCDDFSLVVSLNFSTTRYHRFDSEYFPIYDGNRITAAPPCFHIIPDLAQVLSLPIKINIDHSSSTIQSNVNDNQIVPSDLIESNIVVDFNLSNTSVNHQHINYWDIFHDNNKWNYGVIALLVIVILIPLCLFLFYRTYCNEHLRSSWTIDHGAHTNPAYNSSNDDYSGSSVDSYADKSTQTTDNPFRI